jgi:hypothetical protein
MYVLENWAPEPEMAADRNDHLAWSFAYALVLVKMNRYDEAVPYLKLIANTPGHKDAGTAQSLLDTPPPHNPFYPRAGTSADVH